MSKLPHRNCRGLLVDQPNRAWRPCLGQIQLKLGVLRADNESQPGSTLPLRGLR